MTKSLFSQPNVVQATSDPDTRCIVATWQNLGPHDFVRPCTEAQLTCARQDGAKVIVVDTSVTQGVLSQADQEWFGAYLFSELKKAGIQAVITVLPASAVVKLTTRQWTETGKSFGMNFIDAASLEAAFDAAKQYTT